MSNDNIKSLNDYVYDVKSCLINTAVGACRLGYCLIQIRGLNLYMSSDNYKNFHAKQRMTSSGNIKYTKYTFYDYCKDVFNFSRRSVDRFINICFEFSEKTELSDVTDRIDKRYENYSVSALSELLHFSEKQREKCNPGMGIKQIREIKKNDALTVDGDFKEDSVNASSAAPIVEDNVNNVNWNDTVPVDNVKIDDVPLMKSRTYKKKKYKLSSDDYDCFVDSVSSFTSSFNTVSGYLKKGYLLRLVLYKPE